MTARTRYHAQEAYGEKAGVATYRGVDPITGLPVLIYRFRGQPARGLMRLDSGFVPRLLGWRDDDGDGEGVLVVAWSSAYVPFSGPFDNAQLLDSARALAEAAAVGVGHGSLGPDRFLLAGDSLVIEGFGLPWGGEAAAGGTADITAWAATVRKLGHSGAPGLGQLLNAAETGGVTTAAELHGRLTDVLLRSLPAAGTPPEDRPPEDEPAPARTVPEESPGETTDETTDGTTDRTTDRTTDGSPAGEPLEPAAAATPDAGGAAEETPAAAGARQDEADSGLFVPSSAFASENLLTRDHPAGASGSGSTPVQPAQPGTERRNRRTVMIAVLAILAAVLIVLLRLPGLRAPQAGPAGRTQAVTYVIEVLVEPADLPPVNLYVVESPPESGLRPGSILGTAPRRMALDEGTWVFEGRFQGRTSEPVTIRIPEDRLSTVTIRMPPAGEAAGE